MADKDVRTSQQTQQSEGTQGSQQRGLARKRVYDPLAFSIAPGEFLPSPFSLMNPFALLRRMTEEMDRASGGGRSDAVWSPAIEVSTREGNCVIRAELPGLKPEEVKVEVVDDALVIEGERKFEHEDSSSHRTERMYGRFYRVIQLPEGANAAQAGAGFRDGVLEVTVPVAQQQSNRRQIPIEGSSQGSTTTPEKHAQQRS